MAALFFQDQQLGLSEGLSGIGELKTLVANLMRQRVHRRGRDGGRGGW
ncbi:MULTISPECIES: hypothetical protein [unclassified Frankia]|nr:MULTISPECIES: hypothetical protein [unclassified Frankia]